MYALNGFDVHLIDLTGFGYASGVRMARNNVKTFHQDLKEALLCIKPGLPLFIHCHSMGGLTVATFLANNPHLNIAGVVFSAPFFQFAKEFQMDEKKRFIIRLLAPELDNVVINPMIPLHLVCRDKRIYYQFLSRKKNIPFLSLGLAQSMFEFIDDLPFNLKK